MEKKTQLFIGMLTFSIVVVHKWVVLLPYPTQPTGDFILNGDTTKGDHWPEISFFHNE